MKDSQKYFYEWLKEYGDDGGYGLSQDDLNSAYIAGLAKGINSPVGICKWSADYGYWEGGCGEAFCFEDGGPSYNGFKFCPYCGKKIEELEIEVEN